MTSSGWGGGGGGQVKNGKNVDGSGWLQGKGRGSGSTETGCPQLRSVQRVFQTGVCFCYKCSRLVSGSPISVADRCLVLL